VSDIVGGPLSGLAAAYADPSLLLYQKPPTLIMAACEGARAGPAAQTSAAHAGNRTKGRKCRLYVSKEEAFAVRYNGRRGASATIAAAAQADRLPARTCKHTDP
jgi:hypothetical protein